MGKTLSRGCRYLVENDLNYSDKASVLIASINLFQRDVYNLAVSILPATVLLYFVLLPVAGPLAQIPVEYFFVPTSTHRVAVKNSYSAWICWRILLSTATVTPVFRAIDWYVQRRPPRDFFGFPEQGLRLFTAICMSHAFLNWIWGPWRNRKGLITGLSNRKVIQKMFQRSISIVLWFITTKALHKHEEAPLNYLSLPRHSLVCLPLVPLLLLACWIWLEAAMTKHRLPFVLMDGIQAIKFSITQKMITINLSSSLEMGGTDQKIPYAAASVQADIPAGLYQRLGPRCIRLLILHPRPAHEKIRCTMFATNLDEAPGFEAVSYVWGDGTRNHMAHVNGYTLFIPQNAFHVLHDMSSTLMPRLIWIDTICMNQGDMQERSEQVQIMADIYSSARLVTIWMRTRPVLTNQTIRELAIDTEVAAGAIVMLNQFANYPDGRNEQNVKRLWHATSPKVRESIMGLVENQWFERMWVVQEVTLAPSARVLINNIEISWESLVRGLTVLRYNSDILTAPSLQAVLRATESIRAIQFWRTDIKKGNETHLWDLLDRTAHRQAGDPRDKVFALLGIHRPSFGKTFAITVDHKMTVSEVYTEAARHILWIYTVPGLLARAGIGYAAERSRDMLDAPTWVPNFNQSRGCRILKSEVQPRRFIYTNSRQDDALAEVNDEKAKKTTWAEDPTPMCDQGTTLIVPACELDVISHLAPVYTNVQHQSPLRRTVSREGGDMRDRVSNDFVEALGATLELVERFLDADIDTLYIPTKELNQKQSVHEALCQTLVGGKVPGSWSRCWWEGMLQRQGIRHTTNTEKGEPRKNLELVEQDCLFEDFCAGTWSGRRLCITQQGFLGLVPKYAEVGDMIFSIKEAPSQFVMRRSAKLYSGKGRTTPSHDCSYSLVGEGYLRGIDIDPYKDAKDNSVWKDVYIV